VEGTSLPIGGENTHSVLAGHRGLPNAKLFTDLDLIQKGDRFFLHIMNETLAYEVEDIFTVLPDQTEYLAIEEGRDLCTLITCTPYGVNSHRLLVRGSRIPYTEEQISEETKKADFLDRMDISLKALLFGIAAVVIIWLVLRLKRRRNEKTS
jgi:sortase A